MHSNYKPLCEKKPGKFIWEMGHILPVHNTLFLFCFPLFFLNCPFLPNKGESALTSPHYVRGTEHLGCHVFFFDTWELHYVWRSGPYCTCPYSQIMWWLDDCSPPFKTCGWDLWMKITISLALSLRKNN